MVVLHADWSNSVQKGLALHLSKKKGAGAVSLSRKEGIRPNA